MNIIKQEIQFEESLRQRLEFICEFSNVTPTLINGSIRKLERTNLSYVEPHRVIIKNMDEKDKLRLAINLSSSDFSNINFDKKEILARADKRLREIDEYYKTTIVNMTKYDSVLLTTSMVTELAPEEQNKVVMFLINSI